MFTCYKLPLFINAKNEAKMGNKKSEKLKNFYIYYNYARN